jgi:hypothetical protein
MIRINLLAEDQTAEEMRRRDPVKRAILAGGFLLGLMVVWSLLLQLKLTQANHKYEAIRTQWAPLEKQDQLVRTNLTRNADMQRKLEALGKLSANRFLWSAPLNALQFCMIDNIELSELVMHQTVTTNAAVIDPNKKVPTKPATATEDISIDIKGLDFAPGNAGNHTKFIDTVKQQPYFRDHLRKPESVTGINRTAKAAETTESRKGAEFGFTVLFPPRVR